MPGIDNNVAAACEEKETAPEDEHVYLGNNDGGGGDGAVSRSRVSNLHSAIDGFTETSLTE